MTLARQGFGYAALLRPGCVYLGPELPVFAAAAAACALSFSPGRGVLMTVGVIWIGSAVGSRGKAVWPTRVSVQEGLTQGDSDYDAPCRDIPEILPRYTGDIILCGLW